MIINGKMTNKSPPYVTMRAFRERTGKIEGYKAFEAALYKATSELPEDAFEADPCFCFDGCSECHGFGEWLLVRGDVANKMIEEAYASAV